MPIYTYQCENCSQQVDEYFISYEDSVGVVIPCTFCGNSNMIKIPALVQRVIMDTMQKFEREAAAKGQIVDEPGLDRDIANRRKELKNLQKKEIRAFAEEQVMKYCESLPGD